MTWQVGAHVHWTTPYGREAHGTIIEVLPDERAGKVQGFANVLVCTWLAALMTEGRMVVPIPLADLSSPE